MSRLSVARLVSVFANEQQRLCLSIGCLPQRGDFLGQVFSLLSAFGVAFFIGSCAAEAAVAKIIEEIVRVGRDNLHLALFNSYESWDREAPILSSEFAPTPGRTEIRLELPPGNYGFFIYNDENGNGKLDKTWIEFPNEPYAFSRNYKLGMHKPSLKNFTLPFRSAAQR